MTEIDTPRPQNTGMPKLRLLLLLPLVACATTETENYEVGDHYFRQGQFHEAFEAYNQAADRIQNPSDDLVARQAEARFRSILQSAESHIHLNQISEALQLLDFAEAERPGYASIPELRSHAYRRRAAQLADEGEVLFDDGQATEAQGKYAEALKWDKDNVEAQRGYAAASRVHNDRYSRGERKYFEGLEQDSDGHPGRARTSFAHASLLHGPDSKASQRLATISAEEAKRQLELGREYFESKRIGAAWVTLMDAVRLDPENVEANTLLTKINSQLEQMRILNEADIHVRGGRVDVADEMLEHVLEISGNEANKRLELMRQKAGFQRALAEYRVARACELDSQVVRAREIYTQILANNSYGFEDVPMRVELLTRRVDTAKDFYNQALAAQKAGDGETYRNMLAKSLEQAADYKDALQRFQALQ